MKPMTYLISLLFCLFTLYSSAQITTLLNFNGVINGTAPNASLLSDGTYFYGTASIGGANGLGTLYKVLPDGSNFQKLIDFNGTNGSHPYGDVITDGVYLYGTTQQGGLNNLGTIFRIKFDGTGYTKIHDFNGSNGQFPNTSLILLDDYLYGMTPSGGGFFAGTIYRIKTDGSGYQKLYNFNSTNGSIPQGTLQFDGTYLYGTASKGGQDDAGTLFRLLPNGGSFSILKDFQGAPDGKNPNGKLIIEGDYLHGVTFIGGLYGFGTVYKIKPDGSNYQVLHNFTEGQPLSALTSVGPYFYGTTVYGGTTNLGTIYRLSHDGTSFTTLYSFDNINGKFPRGFLTRLDDALYGLTPDGGSNGQGVLFKFEVANLGTSKNESTTFECQPNPVTNLLYVSTKNSNAESVEIYNSMGCKVMSRAVNFSSNQKYVFDLSTYPPGIYFMKIGDHVQKVVKD